MDMLRVIVKLCSGIGGECDVGIVSNRGCTYCHELVPFILPSVTTSWFAWEKRQLLTGELTQWQLVVLPTCYLDIPGLINQKNRVEVTKTSNSDNGFFN